MPLDFLGIKDLKDIEKRAKGSFVPNIEKTGY
jgi:hypothetical protein